MLLDAGVSALTKTEFIVHPACYSNPEEEEEEEEEGRRKERMTLVAMLHVVEV